MTGAYLKISDEKSLELRFTARRAEKLESELDCDLLLLASPIYLWSCTAPMKVALDRCIYALCKYYGDEKGPSLWEGKAVAALTTCGYRVEKGADLWEEAGQFLLRGRRLGDQMYSL